MTIAVETTSGQGSSVFLYVLLKASSKGCLLVTAPGVWQPHLVFLLGSLASASTHLQMATPPLPAAGRGYLKRQMWRHGEVWLGQNSAKAAARQHTRGTEAAYSPLRQICVVHFCEQRGKSGLKLQPGAVCCVERPPWKVVHEDVGVEG